jgi:hypothetical protein
MIEGRIMRGDGPVAGICARAEAVRRISVVYMVLVVGWTKSR